MKKQSKPTPKESLWRIKVLFVDAMPMTETVKAATGKAAVEKAKLRYRANPPKILLLGKARNIV